MSTTAPDTWQNRLIARLESRGVQRTVTCLIIINAIVLALETSATAMALAGDLLIALDRTILAVFVIELVAKMVAYRARFVRDPWNIFDFIVVGIALIPTSEGLAVLRALRILGVLRLISTVPSLRRVVGALLQAIPGMSSVVLLLSVIYFVFSVMATKLFGASFPEWFGTIGASTYTLFQIMTLESWSMGIVRPVMEVYALSWMFFVPFILITSFAVLNLFIGIIVDAMQTHAHEGEQEAEAAKATKAADNADATAQALVELRREVSGLRAELATLRSDR